MILARKDWVICVTRRTSNRFTWSLIPMGLLRKERLVTCSAKYPTAEQAAAAAREEAARRGYELHKPDEPQIKSTEPWRREIRRGRWTFLIQRHINRQCISLGGCFSWNYHLVAELDVLLWRLELEYSTQNGRRNAK